MIYKLELTYYAKFSVAVATKFPCFWKGQWTKFPTAAIQIGPLPQILGGILSHHKNVKMSFLAKKIHCELLETQKNCQKSQKNIQ